MAVMRTRLLKMTVVGDGMVGKTTLLHRFISQEYPIPYVPTIFDHHITDITVDGQEYKLTLWDTVGQEDYERLRPLSYPRTDCFLLCYSVGSRSSFENIVSKWHPEINLHNRKNPIVLVATKTDLRNKDCPTISTSEGEELQQMIKASRFMECSAKNQEGVKEIFVEAVRSVVEKPKKQPKRKRCVFL